MKKDSSSKKKPTPTMKKDSSSKKKPTPTRAVPVGGQDKPAKKPQKIGSEIDAIFAGKKRKKPEEETKIFTKKSPKVSVANAKLYDSMKTTGKISKSKVFKEDVVTVYNTSRSKKKTADGLTIYSEEELGIGKSDAGGTPLCPFDCSCCF